MKRWIGSPWYPIQVRKWTPCVYGLVLSLLAPHHIVIRSSLVCYSLIQFSCSLYTRWRFRLLPGRPAIALKPFRKSNRRRNPFPQSWLVWTQCQLEQAAYTPIVLALKQGTKMLIYATTHWVFCQLRLRFSMFLSIILMGSRRCFERRTILFSCLEVSGYRPNGSRCHRNMIL